MTPPTKPINLFEYQTLASQQLSPMARDYYASGSWDEITLRDNRAAFERYKLRPRMLVDVSQRDLSTTILGQSLPLPILIAPMAFQCLAHPEGEIATAKAAAKLGSVMVLSTLATTSMEDVASVSSQTPSMVSTLCASRSRFNPCPRRTRSRRGIPSPLPHG
jgi:4-hydroxymandelate oxidase